MKAVRVLDGTPVFIDAPGPTGEGVRVDVVAATICGSDLHLIDHGFAEGRILGHEFAGHTPDGTAVAVEPVGRCGTCEECMDGHWNHCLSLVGFGVGVDGGMAEQVVVPPACLVPLPSGVDVSTASLVEPLAVAVHALHRARLSAGDRVAVVGAGPIGLAVVAACAAEGITADVEARHDHQAAAVERLGGSVGLGGDYDVVFDAVGSTASMAAAVRAARRAGRVGLVGSLWSPAQVDISLCVKEVEVLPATMYCSAGPGRDFETAVRVLAAAPAIPEVLLTGRFPLEGAAEAFDAARDRSGGTVKVLFDIAG